LANNLPEQLLKHEASFWLSTTIDLARNLIGTLLVRQTETAIVGRIVETEAYPLGDPASHAFRGSTARCAPMFLAPGRAYIYIAYGLHRMLNVSAEEEGFGAAVLIRAVELRPNSAEGSNIKRKTTHRIARGPGLVARAFDIDMYMNGADLTKPGPLWIARSTDPVPAIASSPRIGISRNKNALWRFYAQSMCVSR
jgi:DNA-3-methyladenine glycosylase